MAPRSPHTRGLRGVRWSKRRMAPSITFSNQIILATGGQLVKFTSSAFASRPDADECADNSQHKATWLNYIVCIHTYILYLNTTLNYIHMFTLQ